MDADRRFILVVEDSPEDVILIVRALKAVAPTHETLVVGDFEHAMDVVHDAEAASAGHLVLALVDIGLPRIGGLELVETLRRDSRTHDLPVFILSSSDHHLDIRMGRRVGADGFIRKSVNYDELVSAFESLGAYLAS